MATIEAHPQPNVSRAQFVAARGTCLTLDEKPFHFVGTNCYYLMTYAANPDRRAAVDEVLESASQMGLTVIRTWAFNDGEGKHALQKTPGVYDESVFAGLDYVVWKARELGLRLILVLVNNWDDYGGMGQYVDWSPTAQTHDDFYTDAHTRQWFRDYASTMLNRVNTLTQVAYKDDPTIMAWELANEPRSRRARGQDLRAWVLEMSAHIKSIDANHLVAVGTEGLDLFVELHQIASIDFCTVHLWSNQWRWTEDHAVSWLRDRIDEAHNVVKKPLILEEFGVQRDPKPEGQEASNGENHRRETNGRDAFYARLLETTFDSGAAGALFWILYHKTYPDYDGFGVYYPEDASTIRLFQQFVQRANRLSSEQCRE